MEESRNKIGHKVSIIERKSGSISGVLDVIAFDVKEILLETEMGVLSIRGEDLHVKQLSLEKGQIDLEGKVDSLIYSDKRMSGEDSFLKRLFR